MRALAQPQLPDDLTTMTDLQKALGKDEKLWGFRALSQDLSGVQIKAANISEAQLDKVIASEANLEKFGLLDVNIRHCDLTAANCAEASWQRVQLVDTRCSGIKLQTSTLKYIIFDNCKLDLSNFRFSKIKNVRFKDCVMDEADFYSTELENVHFQNCSLAKVEFSSAKCKDVDLRTSEVSSILGIEGLAGATIDSMQLIALSRKLAQSIKIKVDDDN